MRTETNARVNDHLRSELAEALAQRHETLARQHELLAVELHDDARRVRPGDRWGYLRRLGENRPLLALERIEGYRGNGGAIARWTPAPA